VEKIRGIKDKQAFNRAAGITAYGLLGDLRMDKKLRRKWFSTILKTFEGKPQ